MNALIGAAAFPIGVFLLARSVPGQGLRRVVGWGLPLACVLIGLYWGGAWPAWQRLLVSTVVLLSALKGTVLLRRTRADIAQFPVAGLFAYLYLWPGVDPDPFRRRAQPDGAEWRLIGQGLLVMLSGLAAMAFCADAASWLGPRKLGWAGLVAILVTIHFGFADVLTGLLRRGGWRVQRAFDDPLRSRSLSEFWSRRWNVPFIELDRILFLRPLRRRLGRSGALLGVFVISGLLHDFAISYPAGAGWGEPLLYFCLQGVLVWAENLGIHALQLRTWPQQTLAWVGVVAPLPLLFHAPFRDELIVPFFRYLHSLVLA